MSARTDPCGGYQATDIPTATRDLHQQGMHVRVGMEATGYARWFEQLVAGLGFEIWIGDPAEIQSKRVKRQKTDRRDAQLLLRLLRENNFPWIWVPDPENREKEGHFDLSLSYRSAAAVWRTLHDLIMTARSVLSIHKSEIAKGKSKMNILRALQREEKKSLKLMNEAEKKLSMVREAMCVLGGKIGKATSRKRSKMSAATRKKMVAAVRVRWAKVETKSA